MGSGKTQIIAQNQALKIAQQTCKSKQAIITRNDHQDNSINTDTIGSVMERATQVVGIVTGRQKDLRRDDDHVVTLDFYCQ